MIFACTLGLAAVMTPYSAAGDPLIAPPAEQRANQIGQCGAATQPECAGGVTSREAAAQGADKELHEREAAERLAQERARLKAQIEANIARARYCVAGNPGCSGKDFHRLLLGLTRSEVESVLGPPQYQLRLAGNSLYYWTISINVASTRSSSRQVAAIRVMVRYGDCYTREKNPGRSAVCEAGRY